MRRDGPRALEAAFIGTKPIRAIDLTAEWDVVRFLRRKLGDRNMVIVGEEGLRDKKRDLSCEQHPVFLVDAIDGTDLLARGLSNWCSAMAIYHPPTNRILASFVGLPGEGVYYAIGQRAGKCRFVSGSFQPFPLAGPSETTSIREASLAFYGQKVANFLAVAGIAGFRDFLAGLQDHSPQGGQLETRIYNLAGNPALVRLVDGVCRLDAVFEVRGQALHDMIPGAYIAQTAGAKICDLEGASIDLPTLLGRAAGSRIRYVVASTTALARELSYKLTSHAGDGAQSLPSDLEQAAYAV